MNFKKINTIVGWCISTFALLVYFLTLEETASYWDCGEFIATSYKLEIPHPPGAPLFLLLGRLFSFLAMGNVEHIAYAINFMSALSSALTILFLFWSITLLGKKMILHADNKEPTFEQSLTLLGAGLAGSLAYTFSDSFWFSAVEAEVYAMSSFFTAFIVWGMLKWSEIEQPDRANRWFILLAYMMGLSIGIHLLNLVTIPALGLIYYFKKHSITKVGLLATLIISGTIIVFINNFIVPSLPSIAGVFEVFFINTMNLPFGSGIIIFCLMLTGGLIYGLYYSHTRNKSQLSTFLLSFTFVLIGYCSYTVIIIRSNFAPPINENAPDNIMSFVSYLKREQYGNRPLLYGPYFTSKPISINYGAPLYKKKNDRYEIIDRKFSYEYDKKVFFPRAWSVDYAESYRNLIGLSKEEAPNFAQNIYYMFNHQIGTMFLRYFMWNFAGRTSDLEGADWLKPSDWFDDIPLALETNKGRNNFFMIPLLMGLLGAFYQYKKNAKGFAVVALLFIMLGVAINVYLNAPPVEPRERDYIYAGSMYAFTLWIGFAVFFLRDILITFFKKPRLSSLTATLMVCSAPAIMAIEGWDDHNRSNRFFSVDSGKNYLVSCAPNAILYTGGDNDTFMLWYLQEVEAFRTDARVVVLSYYNTDWYIKQSMQPVNNSASFRYTLSLDDYRQGGPNDYLPFKDFDIPSLDIKEYLDLLKQNNTNLQRSGQNIVPSRVLTLPIDKQDIIAKGIVPEGMEHLIVDNMEMHLRGSGLEKKDLAFLDLLATNNWERPIYVNHTSLSQFKIDLSPYAVEEGNVYRILPIKNPNQDKRFINISMTYDNIMNHYRYRGLDDPDVYYSEDYRNFILNHRSVFNTLAQALVDEGKIEKAKEVLSLSLTKIPDHVVPYDQTALQTVRLLFRIGEQKKAVEIASILQERTFDMAHYLLQKRNTIDNEIRINIYILSEIQTILMENNETEQADLYKEKYEKIIQAVTKNSKFR